MNEDICPVNVKKKSNINYNNNKEEIKWEFKEWK